MKIAVYGPGCKKCVKAEDVVKEAVKQAGIEARTYQVRGIGRIPKPEWKRHLRPEGAPDRQPQPRSDAGIGRRC